MKVVLHILFFITCFVLNGQNIQPPNSFIKSLQNLTGKTEIKYTFLPRVSSYSSRIANEYYSDIQSIYFDYSTESILPNLFNLSLTYDSMVMIHKIEWTYDKTTVETILINFNSDKVMGFDINNRSFNVIKGCSKASKFDKGLIDDIEYSFGPFFTSGGNEFSTKEYIIDNFTSTEIKSIYIDLKSVLIENYSNGQHVNNSSGLAILNELNETEMWVHLECFFKLHNVPLAVFINNHKN